MLIAFLFVLTAVKVNSESVGHDGPRISRQLDLGLQDIRDPDGETSTAIPLSSSTKDEVINGYLPPVSSSFSPEFVSAQSQQAVEFKSVNSVEKESELCKPPFDNESCNFKDTSASDSEVSKPSRDLSPPFNELEQELANKATTAFEETTEEIKTTAETQTKIFTTTTTEKPTTTTFKPAPTQNIARILKTTRPKPVANTAEATNELRTYLPSQPEFSAAAQTNVAVVQPLNQENQGHDHHHDHHHGHHHGENFNICDDAFHAFLCAPLKARKRITGALPSSLLGQSSFINYQKALAKPDRETAPSNTFSNEYFTPKPSSSNLIQSTFIPPFSTRKPISATPTTTRRPYTLPKFIPEPSNSNERLYLPPRPDNSVNVRPLPSSQSFSTTKNEITPAPNTFSLSSKTTLDYPNAPPVVPVFNSLSLSENNLYLPPNPNPQPAASFISTSKNIFPARPTVMPVSTAFVPAVTNFSPLTSNSIIISRKPKVQPTLPVFTTVQPAIKLQTFSTAFPTTLKPIRVPPYVPQPSNPSGSYITSTKFQASSNKLITTTVKPYSSSFKFSEQSSNTDKTYLPPDPKEPAAAQISSAAVAAPQVKNPFHHGRDLCTDPFHSFLCVSGKPRKRITGQLPSGYRPESSNTNELSLKPESSNQDESRVRTENLLEGASAEDVGYKYPKPINPLPTPSNAVTSTEAPTTGYFYPKPDKIFPLPSQQDVKLAPPSSVKKSEPVLGTSEARVVEGYEYPKPDKIFPLPGGQENTQVDTTTSPPTTGYSYPKPPKPLPLPTEQKEIFQKPTQNTAAPSTPSLALPTNTVEGYQYPKPDQGLKLPEKKGYSYPKPEKRLELPTEGQSKFKLPETHSNLEALGNLGSAEFIPVNKLDDKRTESSKLVAGLKRFGERMKKRERGTRLYRRQPHNVGKNKEEVRGHHQNS